MNNVIKGSDLAVVDYAPAGAPATIGYVAPTYPDYAHAPTNWITAYTQKPVIKALNGVLLCETFKTNTVKKKERSGFAVMDQKVALVGLKVLVGSDEIPTGYTVYVRGEACQTGWGKETFESEGMLPFIRVPLTEIIYVQVFETYNPPSYPWTLCNTGVLDCNTINANTVVK
jgi:hypothetical protein